jgi:uncharacterized protein
MPFGFSRPPVSLDGHVFAIPHGGRFIVYLPLTGTAMIVNAGLVNLLHDAMGGDRAAWKRLKTVPELGPEIEDLRRKADAWTRPEAVRPFKPVQVSLFLTTDCTLRCLYCYARGGESRTEMPWETLSAVVDEIAGNAVSIGAGCMTVHFHGGGDVGAAWPLLARGFEYAAEAASSRGLELRTSAGLNGVLNPGQREWIVRHIDSATVSLDGPPDLHDSQRPFPDGSPSFPVVAETLRAFDAAGFSYAIRTTVSAEGVSRLEETVGFICDRFSARTIKAEPLYPRGRSETSGLRPPPAGDFIRHFGRARKAAALRGRELTYSGARLESLSRVFCQAAGDSCAVTPEGWITSCYEVLGPDDPLSGTFFYGRFDSASGKMTVDEERRRRLRDLSVLQKPFCRNCFCKWHCAGDCPVKSLHGQTAPPGGTPDRCRINRELTLQQLLEAVGEAP